MNEAINIKSLIADGEYLRAIGVNDYAGRLEIESASARLSQDHPGLGGALSGITQIVTDAEKKRIYKIVCQFRKDVIQTLKRQYGEDILQWLPEHRQWIWNQCQSLLRCDFEKGDVQIGPIAASSLAQHGKNWIVEEVLNAYLPVLEPNDDEWRTRYARRYVTAVCTKCDSTRYVLCDTCNGTGNLSPEINDGDLLTLIDDSSVADFSFFDEPCGDCDGNGSIACDCSDIYALAIPREAAAGSVVVGYGERTGRRCFLIFDRKVISPRPMLALASVYLFHNYGKNLKWAVDLKLEQAEAQINAGRKLLSIISLILGGVVGKLFGSVLIGLISTIPLTAFHHIYQRFYFPEKIPKLLVVTMLTASLLLGSGAGYFLSSWQTGLLIGGIMCGLFGVHRLLSSLFERKMLR